MKQSAVLPRDIETRPYELWRPVVRPEKRRVFENLHRAIASDWSRLLRDNLAHPEPVEFEGIGFENFATLAQTAPPGTPVVVLALEGTQTAGLLAVAPDTARCLVDARLGIGPPGRPPSEGAAFSQIETALLHELVGAMVRRVEAAYHEAGIGQLRLVRFAEQMQDALPFVAEDYLMVFRFRVGAEPAVRGLTLGFKAEIINCLRDTEPGVRRSSHAVAALVAAIPLEVEIVLGAWKASLGEIGTLAPGDSIVLPAGDDAWLLAQGVRVSAARVEFDGRRVVVESAAARR
jgi:flagellar motor switch protein FliM